MTEEKKLIDNPKCIVLDLGSSFVRVGISGSDNATKTFKTNSPNLHVNSKTPNTQAIQKGKHLDFEKIKTILNYSLSVTNTEEEETKRKVMVVDCLFTRLEDRERICEFLFTNFGVEKVYFARQQLITKFLFQIESALILHISNTTSVVPIYQDRVISHAIAKQNYGAYEVTQCLVDLLTKSGNDLTQLGGDPVDIIGNLQKKLSFVSLNPQSEVSKKKVIKIKKKQTGTNNNTNELVAISATNEFFYCMEFLFDPKRYQTNKKNYLGIIEMLKKSLLKAPILCRAELIAEICLSGEFCSSKGLKERIILELKKEFQGYSIDPEINHSSIQKNSEWKAASYLAKNVLKEDYWLEKNDFESKRSQAISEKFF
ncbi:actin [Anaeramoeba flamelloides]|uniref:Actin n=1 Tax=Anaeramoeba flamelloides TaxID=1746091 RepID=A0AAV7YXE9_9EUKA|nr:actin [Anaeramoeba flamelloides]